MLPHNAPYWFGNTHHFYRGFHPFFSRGPRRFMFFSRLFWFGLGAGAYSVWSRHHKEHEQRMITAGSGEHNGEWKNWSSHHFGCHRRRYEQPPVQGGNAPQMQTQTQVGQPAAVTAAPGWVPQQPAPAYSSPNETTAPPVEWQAERMREIGKQASDAVSKCISTQHVSRARN